MCSVSGFPTRGITDYSVTCYDKLDSNERGGEAARLTYRDLSCGLLRYFYVSTDIGPVCHNRYISYKTSSWQNSGVVYLKTSLVMSVKNLFEVFHVRNKATVLQPYWELYEAVLS